MSFWDNFMGKTQANDIQAGSAAAQNALAGARADFTNTTNDYLTKSLAPYDTLAPYGQAGLDSLSQLRAALGLGGPQQQQSFFSGLQQEPGYQALQGAGIDALDKSAAARGLLHSGGQNRDLYSFGNRFLNDYSNNRISQLGGLMGTGAGIGTGVAGAQSGLYANAGNNLANMQLGIGQLFANNDVNTANAMAQSRGIGINNLLGVGNMFANVAKAFNPSPMFGTPAPVKG